MGLCNVCVQLDVRALLLRGLESKNPWADNTWPDDPYFSGIHAYQSRCFRYHENISALKASAQSGCHFCSLVWTVSKGIPAKSDENLQTDDGLSTTSHGTSANSDGDPHTDDELSTGPLYVEVSEWTEGGSRPEVVVSIYPSDTTRSYPFEGRNLCRLEVYAMRGHFPSDQASLVDLLLKEVPQDRSSQAFLAICSDWLNTCLLQHDRCLRTLEDKKPLPTRVIDVGNDRKDPSLFVSAQDQVGRWAALSYCWGGSSDFILTTETINEFQRGRPLAAFPRTIQDAIILTRSLGLQYLWVDAICILQDSRDDWAIQSAEMFSVYANAYLTIAAADSPNVNSGFLGWRNAPRSCSLPWRIPGLEIGKTDCTSDLFASEEHKVHLRPAGYVWSECSGQKVLDSRGWTYQESLFASRRLLFTEGQTIWECSTCQETEAGGVKLDGDGPYQMDSHTMFQEFKMLPAKFAEAEDNRDPELVEGALSLWYTIVTKYSHRALTFETDRPSAIASLARYIHEATGFKYFAGLWEEDMLRGLLWDTLIRREKPPSVYIGPSWSWVADWSSAIIIPASLLGAKKLASIKHVMVDYVFPGNRFGPIKSAVLTIRAPFCRFPSTVFAGTLCSTSNESLSAFANFVAVWYACCKEHVGEFPPPPISHVGQDFIALQIAQRSEGDQPEVFELLFLESVNNYGKPAVGTEKDETALVCRRVGRYTLRRLASEKSDMETAHVGVAESAAYEELGRKRWDVKDIIII